MYMVLVLHLLWISFNNCVFVMHVMHVFVMPFRILTLLILCHFTLVCYFFSDNFLMYAVHSKINIAFCVDQMGFLKLNNWWLISYNCLFFQNLWFFFCSLILITLCSPRWFTSITIIFSPHSKSVGLALLFSFSRWKNWGLERLPKWIDQGQLLATIICYIPGWFLFQQYWLLKSAEAV